ncbi:MAG: ATP-binding protein [Anaerolineae bacterium]
MSEITLLPTYAPELFVDRERETALVSGLVRQMVEPVRPANRTVVFSGERGSGKTWLALHLKRTLLPALFREVPGRAFLIAMFSLSGAEARLETDEWVRNEAAIQSQQHERTMREILEWFCQQLGTAIAADASLSELSAWLARDVRNKYENKVFVLLVDSIFETDWKLTADLEKYLLRELAAIPHVIIVLTGRGRPYQWVSPYLRVNKEEARLAAFDPNQTREQLSRQLPTKVEDADIIYKTGGGHPLTNFLLAQGNLSVETLNDTINTLLGVVRDDQREIIRSYFEALCVLDGFREDEIGPMLAVRLKNDEYRRWPTSRIRQVRDELLETHLMRWRDGLYRIDTSIKRVIESWLESDNPNLWRKLHEQAYQLYHEWAGLYPKANEYYQNLANQHQLAITVREHNQ